MKLFICYFATVIISLISSSCEAKSKVNAAAPYSWRFAPSTWRYHRSSGPIPPGGTEYADLSPSETSYRSSRNVMIPPSFGRKRDTNYWGYSGSSSSYGGRGSDCDIACDGGVCLSNEYRCDGYTQCWDGTDEAGCSCADVIGEGKLCDGYLDCPDGLDEHDCVHGCTSSEFTCDTFNSGSKASCISLSKRCNGRVDCVNGRDEHDCFRMVDLKEETRGVRAHGILQKRIEDEWHTVCKTSSSSKYIKDFAEKACRHVSGHSDTSIKVKSVSLSSLKQKMDKKQSQDLKFVRLADVESKFTVLGACSSDYVYEVQCPTPQCGGLGNIDSRRRKRRQVEEADDDFQSLEYEDVDLEDEDGELIVGGYDTQEMQWPFLVGIFRDGIFYCGGSIVNERWILTAAHCNHGYDKHTFEVQAGMTRRYSWSPYEQTRHVEEIFVHEGYDPKVFANDIALYKLDKPLYLSKHVTPACLPNGGEDDPKAGQYCKVAGWGDLTESGSGPDHMQEVALPVLDHCLESFTRDSLQICAGILTGGKDACQGDSGGPLMCIANDGRPIVNGVVSFGRGCARENEAGAYTRVSAYLDWINSIVNGEYSSSSYHPHPKECSERCIKQGGHCLFSEEKCSGKVDCLGGEDEMGCYNYISRSHAYETGGSSPYWSSYQMNPLHYGISRNAASSPAISSQRRGGHRAYPPLQSVPTVPMSGRAGGSSGARETGAECLNVELECATLNENGLRECISEEGVCDLGSQCSDQSDEMNCIAVTDDFRDVLDAFSNMEDTSEVTGYVMGRYQGTNWHPVVLNEWTLELGQAICNSVSSSSSLKSLETIQMSELAQRLRSGVKLMESTVIAAESTEPIMAMASSFDKNMQNSKRTGTLSKVNLGDNLNNGTVRSDNQLILGYVRCLKMEQ